ncbi:hypothetical protein MCBRY_003987 [Methylocystis bryophila]
MTRRVFPLPLAAALDHAVFRRNRLNTENVIDSKSLERDLCEKLVSTFSHRALGSSADLPKTDMLSD